MKPNKMLATVFFLATVASAQAPDTVAVVSKLSSRTIELPGEFQPMQSVQIHARVRGYVEKILVDRGSVVKQGQLLAELTAPEMKAQLAEAQAKVQAAESERLQVEAQLAGAQSLADRLAKAAETPGAVAGNEVIQAQKHVASLQALIQAKQKAGLVAEAVVKAQQELQAYLHITAPFDGVVTDRLAHPGALVGTGSAPALLVIQQISQLRLVVAVPETDIAGIAMGTRVEFHVPAYPERTFAGTVARNAHSLDPKTRTMPVELDVQNRDSALSPGMYPAVKWPVKRPRPLLFVPKTAVVTTTERTFVIRNKDGRVEWVNVKKSVADGDLLEVAGDLHAGDMVVRRATDEMRDGTRMPGLPQKP